ncbi:MAG: RidA family protein [Planctomycetes bacterium]|nr:RidA family protein [Planctomycetota bacterium]
MPLELVNPAGWKQPKGYSNAVVAPPGAKLVFLAGQVAWDANEKLVGAGDFAKQFEQALSNVVAALRAAGGEPQHLASLTIFVVDTRQYVAVAQELGAIWKRIVGRHYPAMALVQVAALLEEGALVEIQGIAAIA